MQTGEMIDVIMVCYGCAAGIAVMAYFLSLCKEEWKKYKQKRQKCSNHVIISEMASSTQYGQPSWFRKKETWNIGGIDKNGSQSYFVSGG